VSLGTGLIDGGFSSYVCYMLDAVCTAAVEN
jgi:hypothetical protein